MKKILTLIIRPLVCRNVSVGNSLRAGGLIIAIVAIAFTSQAQDTWIQKADVGGTGRGVATGFSIGDKGYIGTGENYSDNPNFKKDFWEYDPVTNVWTQKADFGGIGRSYAVGFSIGSKGYIGTGANYSVSPVFQNDFWEYDPVTNIWTQKANFSGGKRDGCFGFSIGNKGYIGTGYDGSNYKSDFWDYDPSTDTWTKKADFGGGLRGNAPGFSINSKGYAGTGYDNGNKKDFWEYDPTTDVWAKKTNFGGGNRHGVSGFVIGSKGYMGAGRNDNNICQNDFWEYDPSTNGWTQKANFGGTARDYPVAFSINNNGYMGTGYDPNNNVENDFWEYTPICNPCPLPTNIYISDITANTAIVHWSGSTCASSYRIRKRPVGTTDWVYSHVNAPDTSEKIKNNITGSEYEVQVQTYCDTAKTDSSGYTASAYFNSVVENSWTRRTDFGGTARAGAVGFSIGDKGYIGTGFNDGIGQTYNDFWEYDPVANVWTQKASYGGLGRTYLVGFSISNKGYAGTGTDINNIAQNDFWEYDPIANQWTQKANFGGTARASAVGFSIDSKGYIGTGLDISSNVKKDFWEYDPATNTWTQKANFGGKARAYATGFSLDTKGYIGTGSNAPGLQGTPQKDFWEYDPATNAWTQKANFAGTARYRSIGFSIGSDGYIGTGYDGSNKNDFWQYTPLTDAWTQKANFNGTPRNFAVAFAINNNGYIGTGGDASNYYSDFWEYTPESTQDAWSQKADFAGGQRIAGVGFSINSKGYIGTGKDQSGTLKKDFWEYDPSTNVWTQKADFGGGTRISAVGLSIGSKGYIGTGNDNSSYKKDFWEYAPSTNVWTKKKDFAGSARFQAVGFAVGNKGYVGTGINGSFSYLKDFYEYDPSTDTWAKKANFGGGSRGHARGFGIGNVGYAGTGTNKTGAFKDFWQFDPFTDTWTKKADFGGTAREDAVAFSIGSVGYLGTGYDVNGTSDFWEYDPTTNTWIQKASVPGAARSYASAFVINGIGYLGTGLDANGNALKDFYQYTPENSCDPCPLPLNVYVANITTTTATVYWTGNSCAFSYRIRKRPVGTIDWVYSHEDAPDTSHKLTGDISGTQYEVQVQTYCDSLKTDSSGYTASVDFTSGCNNAVISSVSVVPNPICKGKSSTLTVIGILNGATSWQWYTVSCGGTSAGSGTSITVSPDATTAYYVRGEGGCVVNGDCSSITVTVNVKPKAKITALGSLDICGTGSVQLQASSGTGYTYKWMLSGVNISGATNQIYTATQTGDYTVKVTSNQGCIKTSDITTVYNTCKMSSPVADAIKVYPNPNNGRFVVKISMNNDVTGIMPIQVLNALGETVYAENAGIENGKLTKEVQLDNVGNGIYLVKIIIGDQVYVKQINLMK